MDGDSREVVTHVFDFAGVNAGPHIQFDRAEGVPQSDRALNGTGGSLEQSEDAVTRALYDSSAESRAIVAPKPPASGGASAKSSTKGVRAKMVRTIWRCTPLPLP